MKRFFLKAATLGAVLLIVLMLPACKKSKVEAFEASFVSKTFEGEGLIFSIPSEWGQVADPSGSGVWVFAGEDAYESTNGFNNVSVCVYDSGQPAPKLEDVKAAFEADFEAKIKETYPEATEFAYSSFETKNFTVFAAEYRCAVMGKELVQKVYYPLVDNKQIYVASCDVGDGLINAGEAARNVIHTLSVEGQEGGADTKEASASAKEEESKKE